MTKIKSTNPILEIMLIQVGGLQIFLPIYE
jgi:hypothetical protein